MRGLLPARSLFTRRQHYAVARVARGLVPRSVRLHGLSAVLSLLTGVRVQVRAGGLLLRPALAVLVVVIRVMMLL